MDDGRIVLQGDRRALDATGALDVDQGGAVDHDLGDRRVVEERFERPEPHDRVGDVAHKRPKLGRRDHQILFAEQSRDGLANADSPLPAGDDV